VWFALTCRIAKPSPTEDASEKGLWSRRYLSSRTSSDAQSSGGEIEHFPISRESFDSYRRSFVRFSTAAFSTPLVPKLPKIGSLLAQASIRSRRLSRTTATITNSVPQYRTSQQDHPSSASTRQHDSPSTLRTLLARTGIPSAIDSSRPSRRQRRMTLRTWGLMLTPTPILASQKGSFSACSSRKMEATHMPRPDPVASRDSFPAGNGVRAGQAPSCDRWDCRR